MRSQPESRPPRLLALSAGGALLVLVGFALGLVVGPAERVEAARPARAGTADGEVLARLGELARGLERLAARDAVTAAPPERERVATRLREETAAQGADAEDGEPRRDAPISVGDRLAALEASVAAIASGVAAIERFERQRLYDFVENAAGCPVEIEIPPGLSVREYLAALKAWIDSGEIARAHRFWSTERVLAVYGQPDEIAQAGDYVEWKYFLGSDGEQFDLHFVNGLCVQAH